MRRKEGGEKVIERRSALVIDTTQVDPRIVVPLSRCFTETSAIGTKGTESLRRGYSQWTATATPPLTVQGGSTATATPPRTLTVQSGSETARKRTGGHFGCGTTPSRTSASLEASQNDLQARRPSRKPAVRAWVGSFRFIGRGEEGEAGGEWRDEKSPGLFVQRWGGID